MLITLPPVPPISNMFKHLLFLLSFLLPCFVSAQSVLSVGEGWQLSFTVSPDRIKTFSSTIFVTAADTVAREPSMGAFRLIPLRPRQADTIAVNGRNEVFFPERTLGGSLELENPVLEARFQLKAHYRSAIGLEFSGGLNFVSHSYTGRPQSTEGFPESFFYSTTKVNSRSFGLAWAVTYHFLKRSRFQPYLGLRGFSNLSSTRFSNSQLVAPNLGISVDRPIPTPFQTSNIFDFDLAFLYGLSYQLTGRLGVGFEFGGGFLTVPDDVSFQIRYRLFRGQSRR